MKKLILSFILLLSSFAVSADNSFPISVYETLYPSWEGYQVKRPWPDKNIFVITYLPNKNWKRAFSGAYLIAVRYGYHTQTGLGWDWPFLVDSPYVFYSASHNAEIIFFAQNLNLNGTKWNWVSCTSAHPCFDPSAYEKWRNS